MDNELFKEIDDILNNEFRLISMEDRDARIEIALQLEEFIFQDYKMLAPSEIWGLTEVSTTVIREESEVLKSKYNFWIAGSGSDVCNGLSYMDLHETLADEPNIAGIILRMGDDSDVLNTIVYLNGKSVVIERNKITNTKSIFFEDDILAMPKRSALTPEIREALDSAWERILSIKEADW